MEDTKEVKYLSQVIDYEKDIGAEKYRLIQIYSGVGSGKNYWVQELAKQGKNILFITSRKITAEVQEEKINPDKVKMDLEDWNRHTINNMPVGGKQHLVSRTNAWIAFYARNIYDPEDTTTHIWKCFDLIFLDEAHSVVTDATFADSSFQVWRFCSWVVAHKEYNCKVILMSGTPKPLEQLIPNRTRKEDYFNYLDYFEECNHVEPKTVTIRQEDRTWLAAKVIKKYYKKKKRVIYFASSITNVIQLIEDLGKQGITEDKIGVSFTSMDKWDEFTPYMREKKKIIEDNLKTDELIPDDVKIFLTTTKNKEGINIQNEDIKIMFAESSQSAELTQMAGRVRNGLDELIVMYKLARNYDDKLNRWKRYFSDESIKHINNVYNGYTKKYAQPALRQIIADIEECFPYVRYDFFWQKFLLFEGKINGEISAIDDRRNLEEWIDQWYDERVIDSKGIILPSGEREFKKWFPYSIVSLAEKPPTEEEIIKRVIEEYFKEHKDLLERRISKDERNKIMADLNAILKEEIGGYKDKSSANPLLNKGGYKVVDLTSHHKKNEKAEKDKEDEHYYMIVRLDETKQ